MGNRKLGVDEVEKISGGADPVERKRKAIERLREVRIKRRDKGIKVIDEKKRNKIAPDKVAAEPTTAAEVIENAKSNN